jgi:hypothetical protein
LLVLDLAAYVAHALVVKDDGLLRFRQQTSCTQSQVIQNSQSLRHRRSFI